MKKIIIVGAGGCGREVLQWIKDINSMTPTWEIEGFISDKLDVLDGKECDYKILGKIVDWQPKIDEVFAMAIADPKGKEKIAKMLKERGAVFADIIHPSAIIADFTKHGEGLLMYPWSSLGPNSVVGDFVTLLSSGIPHDAVVEDYVTISSNCSLTRGVHVGRGAFLSANVSVLPERDIGEYSYIGLGSVVVRNVGAHKKVFGNPAKNIEL